MGTPKKAKKSPPPSPKKGRKGPALYAIDESLLGRAGNGTLNLYTRHVIKSMWAGHYKAVDIVRRLGETCCPVSKGCVSAVINKKTVEHKPHTGRPLTENTAKKRAVLKKVLKRRKWKPTSNAELRAYSAKAGAVYSERTLRRAKKELGFRGRKGKKKPEAAFWPVNRNKRLDCAKARLKLSMEFLRKVIWIDQSEASRSSYCPTFQQEKGDPHAHVPTADRKCEKVHFMHAIGNGWKSDFFHLPIRRAVVRGKDGKAIHPTLATGRRTKDPKNAKLNLPNEGETWSIKTLMPIFKKWIPQLRRASAVVVDNATSHKQIGEMLRKAGVNVLPHSPYSPDMNLSENAHQDIKRGSRTTFAVNNQELLDAMAKNWEEYSEKYFQDTYVKTYKRRLQAIIQAKGMPTKY